MPINIIKMYFMKIDVNTTSKLKFAGAYRRIMYWQQISRANNSEVKTYLVQNHVSIWGKQHKKHY